MQPFTTPRMFTAETAQRLYDLLSRPPSDDPGLFLIGLRLAMLYPDIAVSFLVACQTPGREGDEARQVSDILLAALVERYTVPIPIPHQVKLPPGFQPGKVYHYPRVRLQAPSGTSRPEATAESTVVPEALP